MVSDAGAEPQPEAAAFDTYSTSDAPSAPIRGTQAAASTFRQSRFETYSNPGWLDD